MKMQDLKMDWGLNNGSMDNFYWIDFIVNYCHGGRTLK